MLSETLMLAGRVKNASVLDDAVMDKVQAGRFGNLVNTESFS